MITVLQVDAANNSRVQKFDAEGNYVTSVGSGHCIVSDDVKNNLQMMASWLILNTQILIQKEPSCG
jgi:hypothetical protein